MNDIKRLETDYQKDMLWILEHEEETDLRSTRFQQMVEQYGGVVRTPPPIANG